MNPSPPWVSIPTFVSKEDIVDLVRDELGFAVMRNDEAEGVQAAGEEAIFSELGHWVINLGPEALWTLTKWALASYAGKKVIDTVSVELTKDAYREGKKFITKSGAEIFSGLKKLALLSGEKTKTSSVADTLAPKFIICAEGKAEVDPAGQDPPRALDVGIEFNIKEVESVAGVMEVIRDSILPLLGCVSKKISDVQITAFPINAPADAWVFWDNRSPHVLFSLNFKRMCYTYQAKKESAVDPVFRDCFSSFGLHFADSIWT